jgi:hypothetical protein
VGVDDVGAASEPSHASSAGHVGLMAQGSNLRADAVGGQPFRELGVGACDEHRRSEFRQAA